MALGSNDLASSLAALVVSVVLPVLVLVLVVMDGASFMMSLWRDASISTSRGGG